MVPVLTRPGPCVPVLTRPGTVPSWFFRYRLPSPDMPGPVGQVDSE
jgi:hypothetical protein